MAILYIVSTPIGNLKDITIRALEVLRDVDLILCEDTRVTIKLLNHYQINNQLVSYHQHSKIRKIGYILNFLNQDKNLALVSDAGAPGISDPGNQLIKEVFAKAPEVKIVTIPGPSALTAAISISGMPTDKFLFMGFPPAKKKRKKFFESVVSSQYPVVLYESPHRIIKTLRELEELSSELEIVVCRELTKKFETIYRGTIGEALKILEKQAPRGEFTIVLNKGR
ncbi:16S rRNA (cytidine(1402)-2'-O)-methyltransferase [Patescibacteria group bacterium]|nr:16S rRNA (cytidine(1402)-2'-O)-methyltransferase [Patescibacteria group bacterium]